MNWDRACFCSYVFAEMGIGMRSDGNGARDSLCSLIWIGTKNSILGLFGYELNKIKKRDED